MYLHKVKGLVFISIKKKKRNNTLQILTRKTIKTIKKFDEVSSINY